MPISPRDEPPAERVGPLRVLELRSVRGTGGGPEKTILTGAAATPAERARITVAYVRDERDAVFGVDTWASSLPIDYTEIRERHSFDPGVWRQLLGVLADRRIEIVHAHDYKTNLLALLLARKAGITAVSTQHGWTGHGWRERRVYYPADKRLARYFPLVLAVSSDIRDELVRHGARPERVVTLLNGIDATAFRRDAARRTAMRAALGCGTHDVVIGSVGRLEPQKRFDLLIDAVAALRATHPAVRLLIVGEGSARHELARRVAEAGLGGTCTLLGHRTDIADLHTAFDLYVQASDYEGTPNTVLEAMVMETPIVATDAGGTRELAADGVHATIVPPGDAGTLTRAMRAALTNEAATIRRRDAARRRVETELSFAARTARLLDCYDTLAARRGVPRAPHSGTAYPSTRLR